MRTLAHLLPPSVSLVSLVLNARDSAAQLLVKARLEGGKIDRLPESCRPANNEDALAIQLRVIELLNTTVGGWKCSMPKGENISLAPLPASTIRKTSPCPIQPHRGVARIEPEIAFVLGRDLIPRPSSYAEADVRDVISETHLVLELIGSRYADPASVTPVENLADSINNQGLFIGPSVPNALEQDLESLKISIDGPSGSLIRHDGRHPHGHPLRPLTWLANFFSGRGQILNAGLIIITGSYAGVLQVPLGVPLTVGFENLGRLSVSYKS